MKQIETNQKNSTIPRWFKIFNGIALSIVLTASSYIIVNNIGNSHNTTSGAGEIWWASAPEIEQSYKSIVKKTEAKKNIDSLKGSH